MIKVGIVGAAGFVGGELIRLLMHHPSVEKLTLQSQSQAGKHVSEIHSDLFHTDLHFVTDLSEDSDVIFVSRGHGESKGYIDKYLADTNATIIDMSRDFRLSDSSHSFIYGLPEWHRAEISKSNRIANCGCFATAMQLALYPLFYNQLVTDDVHIHGITGSTGAGYAKLDTTHFSWRESNVSVYKAFSHQHLDEVGQMANALHPGFPHQLNFIPVRGNFTRGILLTAYTKSDLSLEKLQEKYAAIYDDEPFVIVTEDPIHLKQVINTNFCLLQLQKFGDKVMITAAIDNLLKGAAGQAIQNMNITLGIDETTGLRLKPSAF